MIIKIESLKLKPDYIILYRQFEMISCFRRRLFLLDVRVNVKLAANSNLAPSDQDEVQLRRPRRLLHRRGVQNRPYGSGGGGGGVSKGVQSLISRNRNAAVVQASEEQQEITNISKNVSYNPRSMILMFWVHVMKEAKDHL